jgi:hypothetical protein
MKKPRRVTEKQHPRYLPKEAELPPSVVAHVQPVPSLVAVTNTSCHKHTDISITASGKQNNN